MLQAMASERPSAGVVDFSGRQERASDADGDPRTSNTGVEITSTGVSEIRIAKHGDGLALIDWLSFTIPAGPDGVDVIAGALAYSLAGETEVPALDRGALGYTHGYRLPGSGVVLYNSDRVDMGVHVSLPSGALALIPHDPKELIAKVLGAEGKFTRVDIALDSHDTHVSTVEAAIRRGDLVSRSEQRTYQGSFVNDSFTIYIGARTSDRFVRIYNKAQEQKLTDGSVWTRCEVEFKKHQAQLAATYILQGCDLRSLIFSAIDFRDRQADKNTSRCPQLDWWAAWVGAVERVSFAIETLEKTVKKVYEWVVRQCAPSLAFLDKYLGQNPTWLYALCDENKHRIPNGRMKWIEETPPTKRMVLSELAGDLMRRARRPDSRDERPVDYLGIVEAMKIAGEPAENWGRHLAFA